MCKRTQNIPTASNRSQLVGIHPKLFRPAASGCDHPGRFRKRSRAVYPSPWGLRGFSPAGT
eukprot:7289481-Pyramimonas_sp.AAC.1